MRVVLLTALVVVALPVAAQAQEPSSGGRQPEPARASAAGPQSSVTLSLGNVRHYGRARFVLQGDSWKVRGLINGAGASRRVSVRFLAGGRRIRTVTAEATPVGSSQLRFSVNYHADRLGPIVAEAVYRPATGAPSARASTIPVDTLRTSAGYGASGLLVRVLQGKLASLGYALSRTGVFDLGTGRAVIAYRKVNRMARVAFANEQMIRRVLKGVGAFRLRYPHHGKHAEVDIGRQVLVLAVNGRPLRTYIASTGTNFTPTPRGLFRVQWKDIGYNSLGMLDSSYFAAGGYAIHGYMSVPVYRASHGCVRIPLANARSVYFWLFIGDRVDVY